MPQQKKIQVTLPADLDYSALVRQIAEMFFEMNRFNSIWCHRLKLAVDELFMNAVKYGSSSADAVVHLEFSDEGDRVAFSIEDHGGGSHPISADGLKRLISKNVDNQDLTRTSGRGLALIVHLWTDYMDVSPSPHGGLRIFFNKAKGAAAVVPPAASIKIPEAPSLTVAPSAPASPGAPSSVYTLELKGDIDQYNSPEKSNAVQATLETMPPRSLLTLDLKSVSYINSLFIGHLAAWYNQLKKKGCDLVIVHANPVVKDILDLVGLSRVLTVR